MICQSLPSPFMQQNKFFRHVSDRNTRNLVFAAQLYVQTTSVQRAKAQTCGRSIHSINNRIAPDGQMTRVTGLSHRKAIILDTQVFDCLSPKLVLVALIRLLRMSQTCTIFSNCKLQNCTKESHQTLSELK